MERIKYNLFEKPIDKVRLIRAFGSPSNAYNIVCNLTHPIVDPIGGIIMYGSHVDGVSLNPSSDYYLFPPDVRRRSDLDMLIIDRYLFSLLRERDIMTKSSSLPEGVKSNLSLPLTFKDANIRSFLKKDKYLRLLYNAIQYGQSITDRRMDIKIGRDFETWMILKRPFWVLNTKIISSL